MRAGDIFKQRPRANVLVYGDSGAGKTTWSAKAPMPLVVLCEAHGLEAVAAANPDAQVMGAGDWPALQKLLERIKTGAPTEVNGQAAFSFVNFNGEKVTFQTLVIDSLTQANEMARNYHAGGKQKLNFDIWGRIQGDMRLLLEDLRSLDASVVCLALCNRDTDDEGKILGYCPELYGKARSFAPSYFSAVGVAAKITGKDSTRYGIAWDAKSPFVSKQFPIPQGVSFPKVTYCSLGSIMLRLYPGLQNVPHTPQDSSEHVSS